MGRQRAEVTAGRPAIARIWLGALGLRLLEGKHDPIGAVVWGMDTSNIDSVFVAGRGVKRAVKLDNVDLNVQEKRVTESRDYVVRKARFRLPSI